MKWLEKLKKERRVRQIILDTSALQSSKSMEIMNDEKTKVILLTGTVLEMDKWKEAKGIFGNNVRAIARKSREDVNSERFVCVAGYEKYSYQDKNIIAYCKKNKKTTILTSDNNLCNLAKAHKISYIFLENEKHEKDEIEKPVEEKEEIIESITENTQENNVEEVIGNGSKEDTIEEKEEKQVPIKKHITFHQKSIHVNSTLGFYTYSLLENEEGITEKLNDYKEGDFIYEILCSKKRPYMKIMKYKIIKNGYELDVEEIQKQEVYCMNEIFRTRFSDEVQEEILKIFKENN